MLIVASLALAPAARADVLTPRARLDRARVASAALDYDTAEIELRHAREAVGVLDPHGRKELFELSVTVAFSAERFEDAKVHLGRLLQLEPMFEPAPGAWPPAWMKTLAAVRGPEKIAPLPPAPIAVTSSPSDPPAPASPPILVSMPSAAEPGVLTTWWFWTAVGAAVVGAATVAAIAASDTGDGGRVDAMLQFK